jgi:hypothetical protein
MYMCAGVTIRFDVGEAPDRQWIRHQQRTAENDTWSMHASGVLTRSGGHASNDFNATNTLLRIEQSHRAQCAYGRVECVPVQASGEAATMCRVIQGASKTISCDRTRAERKVLCNSSLCAYWNKMFEEKP